MHPIYTNECSISCSDNIGHKWLCFVKYYILKSIVIAPHDSKYAVTHTNLDP